MVGDIAFTAGYERTQASINGEPRQYVLRVTQVYRREDGEWKVAHRHADTAPDLEEAGSSGKHVEHAPSSSGLPLDFPALQRIRCQASAGGVGEAAIH